MASLFASSSSSSSLVARRLTKAATAASRPFSTTSVPRAPGSAKPGKYDDDFALNNMEAFQYDDVPTSGHLMINRQREILKYHRIVEHEFPALKRFAQPYEPPSPEASLLRFKSIHYQGQAHPVTRKSVMTVSVADLFSHSPAFSKLSPDAKIKAGRKLLHLAGPRWDPGARIERDSQQQQQVLLEPFKLEGDYKTLPAQGQIKISCEQFDTERQNMKWCSDVLDKMIEESTSAYDDGLAELPLDMRPSVVRDQKKAHHGRRRRPSIQDWPSQWSTPSQQQTKA